MVCCVNLILNRLPDLPGDPNFVPTGLQQDASPCLRVSVVNWAHARQDSGDRLVPAYNIVIMIPEDLFELMACPVCIQPLVRRANPEALQCTQCHRVYPVRDGLPVMLIDQATIEPS